MCFSCGKDTVQEGEYQDGWRVKAENEGGCGRFVMSGEIVFVVVSLVVWFLLMRFVLPRLGVST